MTERSDFLYLMKMLMLVMNAKFVSAASYRVTKVVDGDTISVRMGKNDAL